MTLVFSIVYRLEFRHNKFSVRINVEENRYLQIFQMAIHINILLNNSVSNILFTINAYFPKNIKTGQLNGISKQGVTESMLF